DLAARGEASDEVVAFVGEPDVPVGSGGQVGQALERRVAELGDVTAGTEPTDGRVPPTLGRLGREPQVAVGTQRQVLGRPDAGIGEHRVAAVGRHTPDGIAVGAGEPEVSVGPGDDLVGERDVGDEDLAAAGGDPAEHV